MFYNLTKQLFIPLDNAVIMDEYERDKGVCQFMKMYVYERFLIFVITNFILCVHCTVLYILCRLDWIYVDEGTKEAKAIKSLFNPFKFF